MIPPAAYLTYSEILFNLGKQCKYVVVINSSSEFCNGCTNMGGYSHTYSKDCNADNVWKTFWKKFDGKDVVTAWDQHFGFGKDYDWKNKIMILVNKVTPELANVKVYVNGKMSYVN